MIQSLSYHHNDEDNTWILQVTYSFDTWQEARQAGIDLLPECLHPPIPALHSADSAPIT